MGLQKLMNDEHENKQNKKKTLKDEYKKIDKKSTDSKDILKRLELIEKILNI